MNLNAWSGWYCWYVQCQNIREVASRMLLKRWQLIPSNISEAWEELLGLAAFIMARRKAPMHVSAWCHVSGQARSPWFSRYVLKYSMERELFFNKSLGFSNWSPKMINTHRSRWWQLKYFLFSPRTLGAHDPISGAYFSLGLRPWQTLGHINVRTPHG